MATDRNEHIAEPFRSIINSMLDIHERAHRLSATTEVLEASESNRTEAQVRAERAAREGAK